ncbi:hypothetical protein ABAC460_10370 [Asticcacaulis sp. AC460]|uniref:glycoside hydrolase family 43 protein n=1 Tax=Asticcacaulis sp. AC460 TaxID=1282360 RepID=UPI0003C41008|nr:glycoside hydrolase family 43 protein [Asticcacaulis sp. AC460]ESQ90146.1 hypothetical protein ABAC460_10370 [Asticcacaulis sp. AC460]
MRWIRAIAAVTLAMTCGFGAAWADEPVQRQPVLDVNFPDPFVLVTKDGLVAYATNSNIGNRHLNVQLSRSADGLTWSAPVDAMPRTPSWARRYGSDIWAPEVMKVGDKYVMYFSARHARKLRPDGLTLCVGVAVADAPEGPFLPKGEPLTCGGDIGAIDANPFRDGDDLWLYVKTDGNCCGVPTGIIAQRLSPDGLALTGEPHVVSGVTNDMPWEGGVIEATQMIKRGPIYWMFYAGNDYSNEKYATGYAMCKTPIGPCLDAKENPILKSEPGTPPLTGPGHQSLFEIDGDMWIAYHGWLGSDADHNRRRAMYIDLVDWSTGLPVVVAR